MGANFHGILKMAVRINFRGSFRGMCAHAKNLATKNHLEFGRHVDFGRYAHA